MHIADRRQHTGKRVFVASARCLVDDEIRLQGGPHGMAIVDGRRDDRAVAEGQLPLTAFGDQAGDAVEGRRTG